jgi:hypothetical protein
MKGYLLEKKPAFFPFVAAEVFFEAEAASDDTAEAIQTLDVDLDAELDDILSVA